MNYESTSPNPTAPRRHRGAPRSRGARRSRGAPRSRGAQPGNLNALKHGFYSRQFKKADLADLDACQFSGLNDEITVLRVYLRRLIESGKDIHTFPEMLSLVRVMCLASTSLTRLLRVQHIIASPDGEKASLLEAAIAETLTELQAKYAPDDPQGTLEESTQ